MGETYLYNKRRRTPLIDNNSILNVIYTTLLTVKYYKGVYVRLKKENETTSPGIIRKRCRALISKMSEHKLSNRRIDTVAVGSRSFFESLIHTYINKWIDSVLGIAPI